MKRRHFSVILLWLCVSLDAHTAPLRFIPQTLIQPDGVTLHVFASGDEFNNRLHDKDEFTIVQDPVTGYYVYAVRTITGIGIGPSPFIVGTSDPVKAGLEPRVTMLPEIAEHARRTDILSKTGLVITAPTKGTINNLVIFIRFADEYDFDTPISAYDEALNNPRPGVPSLLNYFFEVSYQRLVVTSTFYPKPATFFPRSYKDKHPRAYYRQYNAVTNPIGYVGPNDSLGRKEREQELMRDAVNAVRSEIPSSLAIDGNNDGVVDHIIFIITGAPEGSTDGWSDLLWPHKFHMWEGMASINGKGVGPFNVAFETPVTGILCHEFFHSLSAPDLYRYKKSSTQPTVQPVGAWDIMSVGWTELPHMSAYLKYRYGKWIPEIPEITKSGTYTLSPVGTSKNSCYKIRSRKSKDDYYVVEYRKKHGAFERTLPGEGLLVYRVHGPKDDKGNSSGPPDELYLYRPGGTYSANGRPELAALSDDARRNEMNFWSTDPAVFQSDSTRGDLVITNVGSVGETISFTVWIVPDTLFAGSVAAPGGASGTPHAFSVWYRSVKAPDSLVVRCAGVTRTMSATGTQWTDSVRFSADLSLTHAGRYPVSFTAYNNGSTATYPSAGDSLFADVRALPTHADGEAASTSDVPKEFSLAQNYPNPFNPATTIDYRLPVATRVRLTVYSLVGEEIATLVDAFQPAGTYDVRWNASQHASGMYMYRLTTDRFVTLKKLLLLK